MTITLKVDEKTKQEMIKYYEFKKRPKTPPYAIFQAEEDGTVITLYESGKVVFQGKSPDIDANLWRERKQYLETKTIDYYNTNCIGSDEVGTGDYFGPIIVTACYVSKEMIPFLENLQVKDSKTITDEQILKMVPNFINKVPHKTVILTNQEYNEQYAKYKNYNIIKTFLHNQVLLELTKEIKNYDYVIVDQFVHQEKYFQHLKNSPYIFKDITFITKAENVNLSVACASLISRYHFIKEMQRLSEQLGINLPYGANDQVNVIGAEIVKKYGFAKLDMCAKVNFNNTNKIKNIF